MAIRPGIETTKKKKLSLGSMMHRIEGLHTVSPVYLTRAITKRKRLTKNQKRPVSNRGLFNLSERGNDQ